MLPVKTLLILAFVALVHGQSLKGDFNLKVRVLGWEKTIGLFKISYRHDLTQNALTVADLNKQKMDIYEFNPQTHLRVDDKSCGILKVNHANLAADPLFPIILDNNGKLTDASSLLRVDGEEDTTTLKGNEFQNTETVDLKNKKKIVVNENNANKDYMCTIRVTRTKANEPENRVLVRVEAICDDKYTFAYEIFEFTPEISDDDFNVPDGYYCVPKENDVKGLPEMTLSTKTRMHFTRRNSEDGVFRGWLDMDTAIKREEDDEKNVITDLMSKVEYTIRKDTGQCTIIKLKDDTPDTSPAVFVYGFEPQPKMQILKNGVKIGTVNTFVLATEGDGKVSNIFLTGEEDNAVPMKVIRRSPNEYKESLIEGFTDEVEYKDYDISACLSVNSTDVFRLYFSFEKKREIRNPQDYEYIVVGALKQLSGIEELLRLANVQIYADGSFSVDVLPKRPEPPCPKEPCPKEFLTSVAVVGKIVELVKEGKLIIGDSRVNLVTYETLGAPQATYRGISVFLITFSVSVLSLVLGLVLAVVFVRNASPQNYLRRQLHV